MNHDLADDPVFEDALRSALRADASRAPLPQPDWEGSSYVSRRSTTRPSTGRTRRRLAVLVAAAVVVAGVAARVEQGRTLARRGDRTDRTGTVPPVLPRGDEYRVTEVAGVTATPSGVVKPGSWRAFTVPGEDTHLITYVTANIVPLGAVQRCIELVSRSCSPDSPYAPGYSVLVDGHFVEEPLVWPVLPAGTAYVQFVDGHGRPRWERAIDGMVVLAGSGGSAVPLLTAFDVNGHELGYVGPHGPPGEPDPVPDPAFGDLSLEQVLAWQEVVNDTMLTCLTEAGATFPVSSLRPELPPGTAIDPVWDGCVARAKAAAIITARLPSG